MAKKTKEEVLEAIRQASKAINNDVLSQTECWKHSDITITDIHNYFPKWSDACTAAGVKYDSSREQIPDEAVLIDWGRLTRELGHKPSLTENKVYGKYSRGAFNRFGNWEDIPDVFIKRFGDSDEWGDVLGILELQSKKHKTTEIPAKPKSTSRGGVLHIHPKLPDRPIYGEPINFRGLMHEPVNEQGVVFLFGMVARELGYIVEAVQGGFPDCAAKRKISNRQWQPVEIEFEYESKNFVDHAHDPQKCDVIVCWIHNWTDCPEELEVLELSEEIKTLKAQLDQDGIFLST